MTETQREPGRYKERIQRQEREIAEHRAREEAYAQLQDISSTMLALVLRQLGVTRDNPVKVNRAVLNGLIGKIRVVGRVDESAGHYLLHCEEADRDGETG